MVVIGLDPLSSSSNGALHLFPETGSLSGCMIVNPVDCSTAVNPRRRGKYIRLPTKAGINAILSRPALCEASHAISLRAFAKSTEVDVIFIIYGEAHNDVSELGEYRVELIKINEK